MSALTADTSAVIAALSQCHDQHSPAAAALEGVDTLPAQVLLESYCVLTRLPAGFAVPVPLAAQVLAHRVRPPPLRLDDTHRIELVTALAGAGVLGGSGYDGLVALEAKAHARVLLTSHSRAVTTYRRLGVEFKMITD